MDLKRIAVERTREFGGPWLGLELSRRLGLVDFLERAIASGREEIPWPVMALVLVLGRLCEPSSELHLAEHFYEASALSELLGVPANKINEDRLYRALDQLLPHKEALEKHLKERLGELFDLDYDLLLYDVTSTYFEGEAAAESTGATWLLAGPPAGLQAGEHCAGGESLWHATGLPGLRRQPDGRDHVGGDQVWRRATGRPTGSGLWTAA